MGDLEKVLQKQNKYQNSWDNDLTHYKAALIFTRFHVCKNRSFLLSEPFLVMSFHEKTFFHLLVCKVLNNQIMQDFLRSNLGQRFTCCTQIRKIHVLVQ